MSNLRQIIVMRKDLGMRKGKMIAQGAHASMKATLENMDDQRVKEWLNGAFTKIVVSVSSEDELNLLLETVQGNSNIINASIVDNGATEFNGVPTLTCAAFGPDTKENLDKFTGKLKLL